MNKFLIAASLVIISTNSYAGGISISSSPPPPPPPSIGSALPPTINAPITVVSGSSSVLRIPQELNNAAIANPASLGGKAPSVLISYDSLNTASGMKHPHPELMNQQGVSEDVNFAKHNRLKN